MKKQKIVIIALVIMGAVLTGCEKKKINVTDDLTVSFEGYDGRGTAKLSNEYSWENEAFEVAGIESIEGLDTFAEALYIESAVTYDLIPNSNLSNGDEVTVKVTIDQAALEDYDFELVADSELKYTVSNLPALSKVDLFENIDIQYQGIAPDLTATLIDANTDYYIGVQRYTLDKTSNLNVGDVITVTAEYDENKLAESGYAAESNTKEFIVPETDRYVMNISEIPEDTINKMNKQFEDAINAQVANLWVEKDSLASAEYVGCYLLTAKEGMDAWDENIFYSIYKINVANSENEFSFYTYCAFKNIIILKDGTCSVDLTDYSMPYGSAFFGQASGEAFTKGSYYYQGYEDMDSLFNNCVTKNIEKYEYETAIEEQ